MGGTEPWRSLPLWAALTIAATAACGPHAAAPVPPAAPPANRTVASQMGAVAIATSAAEIARYTGDAACAACHPDMAHKHRASGHARTLAPVRLSTDGPAFAAGNSVRDTTSDTVYRAAVADGRCVLTSDGPAGKIVIPAEWAIGSGKHGKTFLGREAGTQWATLRLSLYSQLRGWDFTPEQRPDPAQPGQLNGHPLTVDQVQSCLSCHATTLTMTAAGPDPAQTRCGVGCERCHGPGRRHIATVKAMTSRVQGQDMGIADLKHVPQSQASALCGSCHRTETTPGPNDTDPDHLLVRFKSTALELSACYRKSGTLTCTDCHDPHTNTSTDTAAYERVCLRCHTSSGGNAQAPGASKKICPVNPKNGCIGCHMPAQGTPTFPHMTMHNHFIKVWPVVR